MVMKLSRHIQAPIDQVFAFFDDPAKTLEFSPHAERFELTEEKSDGRRTYDVWIRSDARHWRQTVEQVLREPPSRLTSRGESWTSDRSRWLLRVTTDRCFTVEGDGTRVDVTAETQLAHPLRRPLDVIRNFLQRGAMQREFDHQLALIAKRIEAKHAA